MYVHASVFVVHSSKAELGRRFQGNNYDFLPDRILVGKVNMISYELLGMIAWSIKSW